MEQGLLRRFLFFVVFVFTLATAFKSLAAVSPQNTLRPNLASQARLPGESWQKARDRFNKRLNRVTPMGAGNKSAEESAVPFERLKATKVAEWANEGDVTAGFMMVRDQRDLEDPYQNPAFKRRLTWLYPDDGCFARAAMMKNYLEDKGYMLPSRIFIFGDLRVQTKNSPNGYVTWWYHTAPIVRLDGEVYVFDPAINPQGPTPVKQWILTQVPRLDEARVAYCAPGAYHPGSDCDQPGQADDDVAQSDITNYLRYEWTRQEELGRDPVEILGDQPPW